MTDNLRESTLKNRYFLKDEDGNCIENFEGMCSRVAKALSNNEDEYSNFYQIMCDCDFLPNSPTLMSAGVNEDFTLSACFVIPIEDSMESIFEAVKISALISKMGGGCGYNFSVLRPKNSNVGSTQGVASGPLSFISVFDKATDTIKQGGKRRGANMAVLDIWHPDVEEFIDAKLVDGKFPNFNFSVAVTDKFMMCVEEDKNFDLQFNDEFYESVPAKKLWDKIVQNAWLNGEPGVIFIDEINRNNVLKDVLGNIEATNPCLSGESLLLTNDSLKRIDQGDSDTYTAWFTDNKDTIKLKMNNGSTVTCTPDHKIMLENGDFINAEDTLNKSIKWGLGNREYKGSDSDYIFLGFIFGDGFITSRKDGVSVKLNPEKETQVSDLLENYGFTKHTVKELKNTKQYYNNLKELESDIEFSLDFLNKRVWERDLPDNILYGNSKIVKSFLRGLFEANGSCNKQSQISLKATCLSMVEKVQILLASFGVPSWILPNEPKTIEWKNGVYTSKKSYNLQIAPRNAKLFRDKIGFYSSYKNDKVKEFKGEYKTKLKVIEIVDNGNLPVYDFNMSSGNHYNFCNGVVVHNCGEQPLYPNECCIASGEKVLTDNGWINIENIKTGDNVAVLNEIGSTFQTVNAIKNNGIKEIYELKTNEGYSVKATEDHRFLTTNGWKELKDLEENDELVIPKEIYGNINLSENCDVDEMLGWIHGDGWTSKGATGISFNNKDGDFEIMDRILQVFKNYFNIDRKPLRDDDVSFIIQTETELVIDKLNKKGIKICQVKERELPSYIWGASNNAKIHFLRGLFASDGGVIGKSKSQICFWNSSKQLIKDVQILLIGLSIKSTVYETEFKTVDRNNQYRLVITCEDAKKFISLIGFGGHPKEKKWRYGSDFKTKRFVKVKEIKYYGKSEVYDISVPGKEHFIVNGLIAHNCTLGSINLSNMYKYDKWVDLKGPKHIDEVSHYIKWGKLEETVKTSVLLLDNIIDKQKYPNEDFELMQKSNRKIGLGIMGFADLLIKMKVTYGSDLSYEIAEKIMDFINTKANTASEELVTVHNKSACPNLLRVHITNKRNATVTTIAPTGTLSIIAECSSGIEPNFAFEIKHKRMDSEYTTFHPLSKEYMDKTDKWYLLGESYPDCFITASEISPSAHIKMQALFQKYTDNAVSKTINLHNSATPEDVDHAYNLAHTLGCKGVTVYRDGSRENQVLSTKIDDKCKSRFESLTDNIKEEIVKSVKEKELPEVVEAKRIKIKTPEGKIFITISYVDKNPYEIFIHHPADTKFAEVYETIARLVSLALRSHVSVEEVLDQLEKSHIKYGSISSVTSGIIKALKLFCCEKSVAKAFLTSECPECNQATLVYEEGCKKCYSCGYSKCI